MRKPALTKAVVRGLETVSSLAYADVEADREHFDGDDVHTAIAWIDRLVIWHRHHEAERPNDDAAKGTKP